MILYLTRLYWRWQLAEARAFAANLDKLIAYERRRSADWLALSETMEARTEIEIVAARSATKLGRA